MKLFIGLLSLVSVFALTACEKKSEPCACADAAAVAPPAVDVVDGGGAETAPVAPLAAPTVPVVDQAANSNAPAVTAPTTTVTK
jgi:hypothetical protein